MQNKHIEHIEESFLQGMRGITSAYNMIRNIACRPEKTKITIKWDGSPSFICGYTVHKVFFISTKSAFNKEPILCYTEEDIRYYFLDEMLQQKLIELFKYLPHIIPVGEIFQGDYLYGENSIQKNIDKNGDVSFQPNLLDYSFNANHPEYNKIINSKIGVCIHTKYDSLNGKMEFNIPELMQHENIWCAPINFKLPSISNQFLMCYHSVSLYNFIQSKESNNFGSFIEKLYSDKKLCFYFEKYLNIILQNEGEVTRVNNSDIIIDICSFIADCSISEINKLKTERGRNRKRQVAGEHQKFLAQNSLELSVLMFIITNFVYIKDILLYEFNKLQDIKIEVLTDGSYETTTHEGYLLSNQEGEIFKLVDRKVFSRLNKERWKKNAIR